MDTSGAFRKRTESEIQPQQSVRGTVTPPNEDKKQKQQAIKDQIFEAAMKNKWTKVLNLYKKNEFVRESKLTRSEDTALHLAISSYHPDRDDPSQYSHLYCIRKMINCIRKEKDSERILKQKNEKGNTPLHLAAELGSVPIIECILKQKNEKGNTPLHPSAEPGSVPNIDSMVSPKGDPTQETNSKEETPYHLIRETNSKGETPLFITAYRGKLQAFLYLHQCCQAEKRESPIELCRREDGDNILHAAISGEYFDLAFQIIHYYKPLVNRYNVEGMSPLHYLSRMPRVFKSGSNFRFIDSIIYYCTNVQALEPMTYKAEDQKDSNCKCKWNLPENYQTIVEFLELLWNGTLKTLDYLNWNHKGNSKDTTGGTNVKQEKSFQGQQSHRQNDLENPPIQGIPAERKKNKLFPANYTVFIEFLKYLMKIVLLVLGIGLSRIKKIKERKRRHTWGVKIMKLMIEKEKRYKFYESTGEKPEDKDLYKNFEAPPSAPPKTAEDQKEGDASNNAAIKLSPTSSTDKKKTDDLKSEMSKTKETPLLVASKMGIVEMVKKILKQFPIAIQDTDSDEKNILLLAVEHRQTDIYNWLIGAKYPEYVFYQVDKHGNNALHLAAMYQKLEVWRIPGSALQLQGERKWYKYVKHTLPPQSYVRYNNEGQTPRQIYGETHAKLLKDGTEWLITTANSCSVVAALIATVAFATSATIPGGANDEGHPNFENQPAFDVFSIASLVSLCFSVTALVFFLAILTSRCQHNDFEKDLPRKLLFGLTSLFASITAILLSFCAAHFFVLGDKYRTAAIPIYGVTCIPVVFFAFNQFPLYVDLIRSYIQQLPLRSYKVFYSYSSETTSSDQKKEGKEKDD